MEIVFESTGSSDNFDAWLQSFKEINNSLLIEVDTKEQQFVAKTFTKEKTIVKYGKLKFESAGFEILSVTGKSRKKMTLDEFNAENPQRIKVGIFCVLDKFINVVKRFSGSDNFKFIIKFDESGSDFVARSIELKSLALKMVVTCANIEEFIYIKDEDFENKIAALDNPISVEVNSDVIKYLIDTSSIFSTDPKKDIIDFRVSKSDSEDGWVLHAADRNNGSYDYILGFIKDIEQSIDITVPVLRNNFILGTKSDKENSTIYLSCIENSKKIKVTTGSNFITIISTVTI